MKLKRLPTLLLASALALVGCGAAPPGPPLHQNATRLPASAGSHVAVIVLENREASDVIGSSQAPYMTALARRGALATRYYAITHPSLPNYLALVGGSTFGIASDCTDCSVSATNLVDQLQTAHVSWRAYMEGLPRAGDTTAGVDGYAKKHDPFMYFDDVANSATRRAHVVPYTALAHDLRAGTLPDFVWITPNLCDDGHDCPLRDADRFVARVAPALMRELGPHGVLFVTWDEGSSDAGCCGGDAAGGRVALIAAGPGARAGVRVGGTYDHYSLLRTIEDLLGLPPLRHAADRVTSPLNALLRHPGRIVGR